MKIPYFKQQTKYTCDPACIRMILSSFGIKKPENLIAKSLKTNKIRGTYQKNFADFFKRRKFKLISKSNSSISELRRLIRSHTILVSYYIQKEKVDHYSIIKNIDSKFIYFLDPFYGENHKYKISHFKKIWKSNPRYENNKRWFLAIKK